MSSYVDKEWFYYLRGREVLIYKLQGGISTGRISQSGVFQSYDKELMYPDEDISEGLRIEYTRVSEPFVSEALETTTAYGSDTNISFTNSGSRITGAANFWDTSSGFAVGDKVRIKGSSSNDGDYTISSIEGSSNVNMVVSETITDESSGERISFTQIPKEVTSPDSTSHINLNKMLCLAVLDYCKAMMAERNGEMDKKEYFMKEFYSKLGDNESNKRNISVAFPAGPFAIK